MKNIVVIFVLFTGLQLFAQTDNGWDDWQKTSCYSKISYRLKDMGKRGEQHVWNVQFMSDYAEIISFNYNITDKLQQYNITTHRKVLNPKELSNDVEVFTEDENIYLVVDKVSLSPYPESFVECD
ncbi:hypothetical protein FMM05_15430 [Flavobacterium zepuense]|uniref:Uncharacterized protein n=1 Tax=Flavobacterium zepuense TaxID=2593302 RepID=A0A552UXY7_9FLAO|nr:hypothetical protein [Flavobacterium zepuense]TRW23083.1 hypothetical protein FMM05_15430 [Flavobacterium zepuense]